MKFKFTKASIEKNAAPPHLEEKNAKGKPKLQLIYKDLNLPGFLLIVGHRSKTFYAEGYPNGKTRRVKVGKYPVMSPDDARKKAQKLLGEMSGGVDPVVEERIEEANKITLEQATEKYFAFLRKKKKSPKTFKSYRASLKHLKDWNNKFLREISLRMVQEKHNSIVETVREQRKKQGLEVPDDAGYSVSNHALATFRAVWEYNAKFYEDFPSNPTRVLRGEWFELKTGKAFPLDKLDRWNTAVEKLNPFRQNGYRLLLFTGLRVSSLNKIKWEHINWEKKVLFVEKPKGGEKRSFYMPLSDIALEILKDQRKHTEPLQSKYAFPRIYSKDMNREPDSHWSVNIIAPKLPKDLYFTPHMLRHSWATAAHKVGIPDGDRQLLMNHALPKSVSNLYVDASERDLAPSAQCVANLLSKLIDPDKAEEPIKLRA